MVAASAIAVAACASAGTLPPGAATGSPAAPPAAPSATPAAVAPGSAAGSIVYTSAHSWSAPDVSSASEGRVKLSVEVRLVAASDDPLTYVDDGSSYSLAGDDFNALLDPVSGCGQERTERHEGAGRFDVEPATIKAYLDEPDSRDLILVIQAPYRVSGTFVLDTCLGTEEPIDYVDYGRPVCASVDSLVGSLVPGVRPRAFDFACTADYREIGIETRVSGIVQLP